MRRVMVLVLACPALPFFSAFYHKRHDFREKYIEPTMCVLVFSTTST
jgi:hypothetical protein